MFEVACTALSGATHAPLDSVSLWTEIRTPSPRVDDATEGHEPERTRSRSLSERVSDVTRKYGEWGRVVHHDLPKRPNPTHPPSSTAEQVRSYLSEPGLKELISQYIPPLSLDPEQLKIFDSVSGDLREKAGRFLSLMLPDAPEGLGALEIVQNPECLRTVLQTLSDKTLVEVVKRGRFFHGCYPIEEKPQFDDAPDSIASLQRDAERAAEWVGEKRLCVTSLRVDSTDRMDCLPKTLCALENLEELVLDFQGQLYFLPPSFGNFSNLRRLGIVRSGLKAFPPTANKLQKIVFLALWANNLSSVPDFGPLPELQAARFDGNSFPAGYAVPDSFGPQFAVPNHAGYYGTLSLRMEAH